MTFAHPEYFRPHPQSLESAHVKLPCLPEASLGVFIIVPTHRASKPRSVISAPFALIDQYCPMFPKGKEGQGLLCTMALLL